VFEAHQFAFYSATWKDFGSSSIHLTPVSMQLFDALLEEYAMIDPTAALNIYLEHVRHRGDSLMSDMVSLIVHESAYGLLLR
jgi:hypothetical protein